MPDERTEPSRPSWRRKAGPAPRAERPRHKWTEQSPKPAGEVKLPSSGIFKVAGAVVGFLACLLAIVVLVILIWPPSPVGVVLVGADYADNLMVPHNILGWKGIEGIEAVAKTPRLWALFKPAALHLIRPPQILDQPERWDALIDDLVKTGFKQQTILIVLGLHGGSNPDGAYLIPDRMARPEERLELSHVIESMAKLPPEKQKILVLEAVQAPSNWRLGMLHNDFARRLEDLEPKIRAIKNLWVLSACGVDQRCWTSEGLGRTVFSHFMIEGLRGKAAGSDAQLTLDELHNYVRENVRNWVWNARAAIQEPVLLPRTGRESRVGQTEEDPKREEKVGKPPVPKLPSKVFLASVEHAPAPEAPAPPDLESLHKVWQRFHQLDAMVPHPMVYSPRRWRQYRAELVRYEELIRVGGAAKAGPVRERIDALARRLESERILRSLPTSAENTLAMNVVAGGTLEAASAAPEQFLRFWNAPRGSEAVRIWDALRASEVLAGGSRPSLRMRIDGFLLERAIEDPVKNLQSAADRLLITAKESSSHQPAEVHFLRMLALWPEALPSRLPRVWGLASQALTVRQLAERAAVGASARVSDYSYSEQVYPWIKAQIEAADQQRRLSEDLLFSSERAAWDRSEKALNQARLMYQEAVHRAGIIRAAFAARDRSLATLPDYSQWLAHRYSDELQNDLVPTVEQLWEMTHALTDRLEKPQSDAEVDSFEETAKTLSLKLDLLARNFADQVSRINGARSKEDWEAATAAAAVPFPETGELTLRSSIWARLENIRDHDRDPSSDNSSLSRLSEHDRLQEVRHVRRRAQIQGLMALSTLGARWFDDNDGSKVQDQGDFDSTSKGLRRVSEKEDERAETWQRELAVAGKLIGQSWQRMAPVIDRLSSEESGISDFRGFEDRLTRADRLGRQIDGAAPRLEEPALEATARLRQARVHDLLLAMAERAWLDHWYNEKPKETPYYQVAGSGFVSDASKLFPNSPLVGITQGRLNVKGNLELSGPRRLVLTSEPSASLAYKILTAGTVPEGLPVVRPVPDRLLELEGDRAGFRAVERATGSDKIEFFVSSPLIRQAETNPKLTHPTIEPTSLRLEGSFRGQPLPYSTEVQLHPVPDTIAIGPPPPEPPDASIAIRASQEIIDRFGAGTGSIAIVLDCSGSMMDPSGIGRATKFDDAQTALGQVLKLVPQSTMLSLWTFSQLPVNVPLLPGGGVDPGFLPLGLREEPELTIKPLLIPRPWDPNQTDALVQEIRQLHPFFDTPLVWAMWKAANSDLANAKGLKTLLVLTDGDDNRLGNNPKYNPNKMSIHDFVVAGFKPLNIRVNMIFFTPAGDKLEIARARENFEGALRQLEPPGNFVLANNLGELIATLKRGIRQKLTCEILKPPDWTQVGEEPLEATGPGDADKWWTSGLEPGTYKLRVHADKPYEQEIDLKKGDRIVIQLVEGPGGGIAFQRALYSDQVEFGKRVPQETEAWRLAVLANQRRRQGEDERLQLFATLERKPGEPGPERLQQVKPRRAWFRLDAEDVEHPEAAFSMRWRERIYFPGPAWHFDVPRWIDAPAGGGLAKPILKAWWRGPETEILRAHAFPFNPPGDPGVLPRSREVEDGKTVTIESLGIEDHHVEVQPGEPLQTQPCLVIRLALPENSPYIVDTERLTELKIVGYEHHLYSRASKYTGLFWPVNQPKLEKLSGVSLIALDAFRNQAKKEKCTLEIKLPPPRVEDQLPDPPVAIVKGK